MSSTPSPDVEAPVRVEDPSAPAARVRIVLSEAELEGARQWQEERLARRLHEEGQRAGRAIGSLVEENLDAPLHLNAIRLLGAPNLRPAFLSRIVAPYLTPVPPSWLNKNLPALFPPPPEAPRTLREVLQVTRDLNDALTHFDVFSAVGSSLESSPSVLSARDDVDILLQVVEAPRYFVRTSTDVGDGEGSASLTARARNAFGGAEIVEGAVSFGTRTKSSFSLKLDTPVLSDPKTRFDLSIFGADRNLSYFAQCIERSKGAQARIRGARPWGTHEFAYEAVLRDIGQLGTGASMSLRDAAGPSVKSAVSHVWAKDGRDDALLPTRGGWIKARQEYAGLGGDAEFVKLEAEGGKAYSLPSLGDKVSFSSTLKTGLLLPTTPGAPSLFPDRFHLGGPTSVRLFRTNAMGPKDSGDYMGGDLMWAAGASLLGPLYRLPDWPLRWHVWLNAGKLASLTPDAGAPVTPNGNGKPSTAPALSTALRGMLSQPSVTAGLGLVYRHEIVRVEANVGVPLAMGQREGGIRGLQFGLGLSFL